MSQKQPAVFSFFPHLINKIGAGAAIFFFDFHITFSGKGFHKAVSSERNDFAVLCKIGTSLWKKSILQSGKASCKNYATAPFPEGFQDFQSGTSKCHTVRNQNHFVIHTAHLQFCFFPLSLIQFRQKRFCYKIEIQSSVQHPPNQVLEIFVHFFPDSCSLVLWSPEQPVRFHRVDHPNPHMGYTPGQRCI